MAAVKVLFYDMALTVLGYITNMASGIETLINKIPGVTVDLTSGLDSFYAKLESAQKKVKDEAGWVEYVKKMDYIDYSKAAGAGYRFGEGLADKVAGVIMLGWVISPAASAILRLIPGRSPMKSISPMKICSSSGMSQKCAISKISCN